MGNKLASCTSGCLICGLESSPVHFHFPPRTASAPFTIRPLNNVDYQSCSPSEKDSLGLGHGSPQAGRAQSRRAAAVGIGRSPWPVAASVNRRPAAWLAAACLLRCSAPWWPGRSAPGSKLQLHASSTLVSVQSRTADQTRESTLSRLQTAPQHG
jgi:hypothetical protein